MMHGSFIITGFGDLWIRCDSIGWPQHRGGYRGGVRLPVQHRHVSSAAALAAAYDLVLV